MAKPVHVMLRVREEARSVDFYARAFGLTLRNGSTSATSRCSTCAAKTPPFEVELTVTADRQEPYALGDGYGHIAVTVADLGAEHGRLAAAGLAPGPIRDFKHDGRTLARFFFVADPDGYRTEVIERGGRFV